FITVSVGMVLANRCHRQNMKTSIINGSEVSRLSVAIHISRIAILKVQANLRSRAFSINAIAGFLARIVQCRSGLQPMLTNSSKMKIRPATQRRRDKVKATMKTIRTSM
ncbi:hypothetical protein ACQUY2_23595, partial [Enterobacter hormaechei]|uniref:hypothetical protein n=1 Tax=Enterobacter hormaechei TaxID=158836 RepID=UPI003D16B4FA